MLCVIAGMVLIRGVVAVVADETSGAGLSPLDRHKLGVERAPETDRLFESHVYTDAEGGTIPYRLLRPLDYDPLEEYPLVVCLSGIGGRGTDNIKQIGGCWPAQILAEQENRERYPSFVLVPQCPLESHWGVSLDEHSLARMAAADGRPLPPGEHSLVLGLIEHWKGTTASTRPVCMSRDSQWAVQAHGTPSLLVHRCLLPQSRYAGEWTHRLARVSPMYLCGCSTVLRTSQFSTHAIS